MKAGDEIICPHCKGEKGKTQLLYYWIKCYLCEGVGKMTINEIVRIDKNGDTKAKFTINLNNNCVPRLNTKIEWLF
jgi:RecJ-like exonuclease